MSLRAIYFSVQDVGKHVKKSKRRFIWKFITKGQEHVVEMYVSYLSGKKDILLDSRSIYQAQKVTSSFQFPFQVENNQCMIVQHGDQYELRVNNQVFSHLYNQERMKREFEYVDESSVQNKGYDEDNGYKNSGFVRRDDSDDEIPSRAYKPKAHTTFEPRVQEEPRFTASKSKPEGGEDDGLGFADAFSKFDYKSSKPRSQTDALNNYDNKYSGDLKASKPVKNSGFDDFEPKNTSTFDQFSTQPSQPSGFDQFSQFDQKPANVQSGFDTNAKLKSPPAKTTTADLLDLDFVGNHAQPSNPAPVQAGGFNDFFSQPSQPTNQTNVQQIGGFNAPAPMNQSQGKAQTNLNDLMGLEFNNLSVGSTEAHTTSTQPQIITQNQSGGMANFLDDQPQVQTQSQSQPQPQTQTQQKKDLWNTDLVSLNSQEVPANNKGNQNYDYGVYNNNAGYGNQNNYNNNYGGYNTNAGYGGMNANAGMGGYGAPNQGFATANQSYGGNQAYGMNQAGYGGNQGFSGGNYSGFETNANSNQGFNNAGGYGAASHQQYGASNTANDVKTPFDF